MDSRNIFPSLPHVQLTLYTMKVDGDLTDYRSDVLSDFQLLNFKANPCLDTEDDINYNKGKTANPFDKISKYYGKKKNVFFFVELLKNDDFVKELRTVINEKCDVIQKEEFFHRMELYLNRIKYGETEASKILGLETAFFNGPHVGDEKNMYKNLNINCIQSEQTFHINDIFCCLATQDIPNDIKRIKIYSNGVRAVTITNESFWRYNFIISSNFSGKLAINWNEHDKNLLLILTYEFGLVRSVTLECNGREESMEKTFQCIKEIVSVTIRENSLHHALSSYFEKKIEKHIFFENDLEECLPIKSWKELQLWKGSYRKHRTDILQKRISVEGQPKTLVCHDMKGGYLSDRFINGLKTDEDFHFLHWSSIDIFVYFSHHLVSIPPCSWISAAHKNGVEIFATFITEWDDGAQICEEFLQNEESVLALSLKLAEIAVFYNFDGWLINIENVLNVCKVSLLVKFVKHLTENMHNLQPGSHVIWYDSVIETGELKWQNSLNTRNKLFFDVCDGIFLNYNWNEEKLRLSAELASHRKKDIYVGVDVFGRGCFGGGGFSTDKAVQVAIKYFLSVAIFAPGWLYECLYPKHYHKNQYRFWEKLQEFCPTRSISGLPFYTSFCPGFGKFTFRNGNIVDGSPWFNLSLQQPQAVYSSRRIPEGCSLEATTDKAYSGGGCVQISGKTAHGEKFMDFPILSTNFKWKNKFLVSYTFLKESKNVDFGLHLSVISKKSTKYLHLVDKHTTPIDIPNEIHVYPALEEEIVEAGYVVENQSSMDNKSWCTRVYILCTDNYSIILKINARIYNFPKHDFEDFNFYLGQLLILPLPCESPTLSSSLEAENTFTSSDLICKRNKCDCQTVNIRCKLDWKHNSEVQFSDLYLQTDGIERRFIGATSQFSYRLNLNVPYVPEVEVVLCQYDNLGKALSPITLNLELSKLT